MRIREFDWAATPAGSLERWPVSLNVAVRLMLAQDIPTALVVREGCTLIYNDACAALIGSKDTHVLGSHAAQVFAEERFSGFLGRALEGETVTIEDQRWPFVRRQDREPSSFDVTYLPVRDELDAIGAVMVSVRQATAHMLGRKARDEIEKNQAFLLRLSDSIRAQTDADALGQSSLEMLAQHLGVQRAYICNVLPEEDRIDIRPEFRSPGLSSIAGAHRLSDFPEAVRIVKEGTIVIDDCANHPDLSELDKRSIAALGIDSFIGAGLRKDGGDILLVLNVTSDQPRTWTYSEVSLVHDVAERIWNAMQRARAETALRESEETVRMALEAGRMGTWRYDLATGEQQWSEQQFRLYGLEPGSKPPSRDLFVSLVHPEDIHLIEFVPRDLAPTRGFLDAEFRIVRPDGEIRWLVSHTVVGRDANGTPIEMVGLNWDITERKRADDALQKSEERFRQFGEASQDILWIRDAATLRWVYLTPAFETIYGLKREDALGAHDFRTWTELIVPEDRERAVESIERVRQGESVAFEYRIRRPSDGQVVWLRNTDFPIADDAGRVTLIGGVGHDITPVKHAAEHQRFLLSELQHRVRNTLAVIRSITRRTAATTDTKDDFFMHLDGRIDSFARVQAAVTRDPSKGVDLAFLIAEELRVVGAQEGHDLKIDGPALGLAPKAAEMFGLAIHELATNAMKYGALANLHGNIGVSWQIVDNGAAPQLEFRWDERGVRDMPPEPRRKGFGTEILERSLAYELKAVSTLAFRADGVSCHIAIPLEQLSPAARSSDGPAW